MTSQVSRFRRQIIKHENQNFILMIVCFTDINNPCHSSFTYYLIKCQEKEEKEIFTQIPSNFNAAYWPGKFLCNIGKGEMSVVTLEKLIKLRKTYKPMIEIPILPNIYKTVSIVEYLDFSSSSIP
jgi:hypothetical protein